MSTAVAAASIDRSNNVSDLLDILYEILASGLEPEGAIVSSSEIETFLHQHARSPKSRPEMEAFFSQSRLPMQLEPFARDSGLRLASVSPATVSSSGGDLAAPESNTGRHAVTISKVAPRPTTSAHSQAVAPVLIAAESNQRLWIAIAGLGLALLTAALLGGYALMSMRDQLDASRQAQRELMTSMQALRSHTERVDTRLSEQARVIGATHQEPIRLVQSFLPLQE